MPSTGPRRGTSSRSRTRSSSCTATACPTSISARSGSFHEGLKYVLRQDPDIILVGEIRDLETMSTALMAADTGHLVMYTTHTTDVVQTLQRIISFYPPHQHD